MQYRPRKRANRATTARAHRGPILRELPPTNFTIQRERILVQLTCWRRANFLLLSASDVGSLYETVATLRVLKSLICLDNVVCLSLSRLWPIQSLEMVNFEVGYCMGKITPLSWICWISRYVIKNGIRTLYQVRFARCFLFAKLYQFHGFINTFVYSEIW